MKVRWLESLDMNLYLTFILENNRLQRNRDENILILQRIAATMIIKEVLLTWLQTGIV